MWICLPVTCLNTCYCVVIMRYRLKRIPFLILGVIMINVSLLAYMLTQYHETGSKLDGKRVGFNVDKRARQLAEDVSELQQDDQSEATQPWQLFQKGITKDYMYAEDAPYMQALLNSLAKDEIVNTSMFVGGSQVKLYFKFANGNTALIKPMRMKRSELYPYKSKHPFWLDPERHNAEIASFHLDRILNFRRGVPVAGRLINMTKDILQKCNDKELLDTIFEKDGNLCFIGKCAPWFCNDQHPICGKGDMMEVSVAQFLPKHPRHKYPVIDIAYPWSQGLKESKVWKEANICNDILKNRAITNHRSFLDLIDLAIFDFLIVNYDRHHYSLLNWYKNESFVASLDNGKGFGNYKKDDVTFLAPVYQCCKIRRSTYNRIKQLTQSDTKLSKLMRKSMSHDVISPILNEKYLLALDRRLNKALEVIQTCFMDSGEASVLIDSDVL